MNYRIVRTNELTHHGILGQKWGKRNGPPYPLGDSDRSPKERAMNSKSKSSNKEDDGEKHKGLTDSQKKAIKIGAAVTATALVAVGGVYLYKTGTLQKIGQHTLNKTLVGGNGFTPQKVMNPMFGKDAGANMNCGNIALAEEARNRGHQVIAKLNEKGMMPNQLIECFNGATEKNIHSFNLDNNMLPSIMDRSRGNKIQKMVENNIKSQFPSGSRGIVYCPTPVGNHFMPWKIDSNGKFSIGNPQNNSMKPSDWFGRYMPGTYGDKAFGLWSLRVDDLELNMNKILEYVEKQSSNPSHMDYSSFSPYNLSGSNFVMQVTDSVLAKSVNKRSKI